MVKGRDFYIWPPNTQEHISMSSAHQDAPRRTGTRRDAPRCAETRRRARGADQMYRVMYRTQLLRHLLQGWRSLAHDDATYYIAATAFDSLAATFAYDAIR